jgi:Bacterial PH domain
VSSSQDSRSSSGAAAGRSPDSRKVFRSGGALAIWYVWLAFAVANLIDLAIQGHNHTSAVAAAVLLLVTGLVYVAALRPRIIADEDSVTVRNPFRDIRVPWGAVTGVDVRDVVRVTYQAPPPGGGRERQRVLNSWALHSSRRSRMRAERKAKASSPGLKGRGTGYARPPEPGTARMPDEAKALLAQPTAVRAATQLNALGVAARGRGAPAGAPVITWSWGSAAAIAGPVLLIAVVILIP